MAGIGADIGKAPVGDSNLPAVKHLARLDIHQTAAGDDKVGGRAPGGHGDKTGAQSAHEGRVGCSMTHLAQNQQPSQG